MFDCSHGSRVSRALNMHKRNSAWIRVENSLNALHRKSLCEWKPKWQRVTLCGPVKVKPQWQYNLTRTRKYLLLCFYSAFKCKLHLSFQCANERDTKEEIINWKVSKGKLRWRSRSIQYSVLVPIRVQCSLISCQLMLKTMYQTQTWALRSFSMGLKLGKFG